MDQIGQRPGQSNNAFASGTNPNAGNVITDRSSSRVLAPPGGGSSFSLGGGYEEPKPQQQQ
jgi:SPIRAL1-like protein